jgi:hypothetical protein
MHKATAFLAGLATFVCASSLQAHHSGFMYETTPIWVGGTVVAVENVSPHSIISLEDRTGDGQVRRWAVEGPANWQLERMGMTAEVPQVGDVLEFCAFPYKSPEELSRIFPGVDFSARRTLRPPDGSSPQYVAGHVMLLADGQKRSWEPHGFIAECIRSSDESRQSWLAFINASPRAREAWCAQRRFARTRTAASLEDLVEEINGLIDNPCE